MIFEWDEKKAQANIIKHGVSFNEAQSVFEDIAALQIFDPDHSEQEDRFILLGLSVKLRILIVCHCEQEKNTQHTLIRIISARKATKSEANFYIKRK